MRKSRQVISPITKAIQTIKKIPHIKKLKEVFMLRISITSNLKLALGYLLKLQGFQIYRKLS